MLIDPTLERVLTAGILATLAIAVAFGPELGRAIGRMRNRRAADVVSDSQALSVEAQRS